MDPWLYTEEHLARTPSILRGMSRLQEEKYRRDGVGIIMKVGSGEHGLKLKTNATLATAAVFFHRFYMTHTFQEYPKEITALTCLFLAGKVEETPKKCRDICRVAESKFPEYYAGKYQNLSDEVMGVERVLLVVLKFDLQVEHPYKYIPPYVSAYKDRMAASSIAPREYVQKAWTFTNDSFYTPICLLWEPEIVAIGMIHLSFNLVKNEQGERAFVPPDEWWNAHVSNLSPSLLEQKVLDFYAISRDEAAAAQGNDNQTSSSR